MHSSHGERTDSPQPAPAAVAAADDGPVRVGICGLGYGLYHANQLRASAHARHVRFVAAADGRPERLRAGTAALGCRGVAELEDLLRDPEVEAVALFTGPSGRAEQIRRIVRAGKDVMTTKPLELDADAALAVLREARDLGRTVFLNSPAPVLGDDLRQVRAWQEEHRLGRLIFALTDCWYRSTEKADGTWYDDPSLCPAAPIFRLGIYGINDVLALVDDEVAELQVLQARVLTGRPTPDVAQLGLRFAGGTMATIRATWCCGPWRDNQASEFVFERGVVRRTYSTPYHKTAPGTLLTLETEDGAQRIFNRDATVSNHVVNSAYRWDLFHDAVRGRPVAGLLPPERLVAGLRVIARLKHALERDGRWPS
jgi:predicted dehydrogenase